MTPLFGQSMGYVEFPELETAVYGLSYHRREIKEPLYDRCFAQGRQKYEILLAHGGDDKHIPFNRGALEKSGFDYIALGHIHKPAVLEENRIIYAGALEPVDRNDTGAHGYVRGEITERGVRARWIPCAEREYIHLTIPVNEKDTSGSIKKKISESKDRYDNKNIYKITLTGVRDEDVIPDTAHMDDIGNVLEIVDETRPAFDPEQLLRENRLDRAMTPAEFNDLLSFQTYGLVGVLLDGIRAGEDADRLAERLHWLLSRGAGWSAV